MWAICHLLACNVDWTALLIWWQTSFRSDEGLTLETSASLSYNGGFPYELVCTKFSCGYACVKYVICSWIVVFVSCNLNFCCLYLQIPILQNFLFEVFRNYNATPFHNFRHAFCVTQMVRLLASLIRQCMALLLRLIGHLPLGAVFKWLSKNQKQSNYRAGHKCKLIGSLSKHDVDGCESVIWKCNFAFLISVFNYSKSLCLKNVF